jgi:CubicO group peptidase (beta-lactamase class C family)
MASAGKFITHIAALQCVERGLITLDEPVYPYLPELKDIHILERNEGPDASTTPFLLQRPTKEICLRHLLSHSSGIDYESHPLVTEWRASKSEERKPDYHPGFHNSHPLPDAFSTPLLFEPEQGWMYGASIEWTEALVSRLVKQPIGKYVYEQIFTPLGMASSKYDPQNHPEICSRILQMVRRDGDRLLPAENQVIGLVSSVPDLCALFADLMSSSSSILKTEYIDLLFEPQFAPGSSAFSYIRSDTENYAAPAGIPTSMNEPPVNHSLAALVVEGELPLSHMPAGTVTWNGMPNVIWAMHREKGLGLVFATQLLPVDNEKTVELAMTFMREAWRKFG